MNSLPNLKAAFRPGGAFRVWGCTHMETLIAEGNASTAQRKLGTARDKFFLVAISQGVENATLNHLKRNIAEAIVGKKIRHMPEHGDASGVVVFGGMAAQFLQMPTWLAPPGMGSLYRKTQDGMEGYIDSGGENTGLRAFYLAEFGANFAQDDLGYLDYNQARQIALTAPPWSTERWLRIRNDDIGQTVLRLPSGLELHRSSGTYPTPEAKTFESNAGHLYIAPGATPVRFEERENDHVLILENKDHEDCGVFVRPDGSAILMQKLGPRGSWAVNLTSLAVVRMRFAGGAEWTADGTARPPITTGLLERVTPAWYW
jgi:hypothetical protein